MCRKKSCGFTTLKLWINLSFSFKYLKLNVKILYYGEINNKMNIKGMLCFPLINQTLVAHNSLIHIKHNLPRVIYPCNLALHAVCKTSRSLLATGQIWQLAQMPFASGIPLWCQFLKCQITRLKSEIMLTTTKCDLFVTQQSCFYPSS